jgi:pimeloyl-ACP methyl ester carboxylesterase
LGEQVTVRAPDGRVLDVFVDGPASGLALLFHNGTPSSGQLYEPFVEAAAQRGLRMVGFSRAGYGGSTRKPGRSVADVVPDVDAVLDAIGVDYFYTLGWSGGGPHALACAALLQDRLIAAATVGSLAPYKAEGLDWMMGMGGENVQAFRAALAGEETLRSAAEAIGPVFASATADRVAASLGDIVSDVDRSAVSGAAATWLAEVFRESGRNGIWGWYDDELALTRPWGFDVADVEAPVAIWQGSQDRMTPYEHGRWLAAHVRGARAHLLADHGHLSLGVASFGPIVEDLVSLGGPGPWST